MTSKRDVEVSNISAQSLQPSISSVPFALLVFTHSLELACCIRAVF